MDDTCINLIDFVKKRYGSVVSRVPCAALVFEYEDDPCLQGLRREGFIRPPVRVKLLQKGELRGP